MGISDKIKGVFGKNSTDNIKGTLITDGSIENINLPKKKVQKEAENEELKIEDASTITRIFFSCSHMNMNECFTFNVKRKADDIKLSSWYFPKDAAFMQVELEGQIISEEDFDIIKDFLKGSKFLSVPINTEKKDDELLVSDKTVYSFEVSFENGLEIKRDGIGELNEPLRQMFVEMSDKYLRQ